MTEGWHNFNPSHDHLTGCEQCQETHRELWAKHIGEPVDREALALEVWNSPADDTGRSVLR